MSQQDSRKLTCTACQHENEVERVYCHNCGEKLDRSLLPKADITKPSEDKAKVARKVKKMMDPNRFNWWLNFKTLLLVEFLAVFVAVGYLIVQAPRFVVPLSKEKMPDIEVGELWSEMLRQKPTVFITFKEFDVNYFLSKTMKGGGKSEGTFAHFEPGLVTVATQRSVLGLSICNSASFTPARDGVKWKADVSRFAIGRLTVPVVLAKLIGLNSATLGAFAQTFDKDIQRLDRLEKIESGEGSISFTTKPQQ
jgi:hypothetical protein